MITPCRDTTAPARWRARPIVDGESYHTSCIRLVGKWAQQGVAFLDAQQRLYAAFDAVANRDARWQARRDDVPRIVRDIYGKEAEQRDAEGRPDIDIRAPYDVANLFLAREFTIGGRRTLHRHLSGFYHWNGASYPEIDETYLRHRLYPFLGQCRACAVNQSLNLAHRPKDAEKRQSDIKALSRVGPPPACERYAASALGEVTT
jgi:hypothetical protein